MKQEFDIQNKLNEFIKRNIPEEVDKYEFSAEYALVELLAVRVKEESKLFLPYNSSSDRGIMFTPIAKILSDTDKFKKGDIVRLPDYKTAVFKNPDYEEWNSVPKNGNIKKIGEVPPNLVCRIHEYYGKYVFNINVFSSTNCP